MTKKTTCIVAPHCDDAMLSVGGYILQNKGTHVIDLFATTAWTTLDIDMSVEEITSMNQTEERWAMTESAATLELIETPEALMRGYKQWNEPVLKKTDYDLVEELWSKINVRLATYDQVFFPIAPGDHVDHRIVRQVILDHADEIMDKDVALYCYEDLPYSWYGGLEEALTFIRKKYRLMSEVIDISSVFEQKLSVLAKYRSQLSESDIQKVRDYALDVGNGSAIERIWRVSID